MKTLAIFDEKSGSTLSDIFTVAPNEVGILSAYGLLSKIQNVPPGGNSAVPQRAVVQKLAFSGGIFPNGDGSCKADAPLYIDPPYSYAEDVVICGPWALTACQNIGVLGVPGSYRLELNDTAAVGQVFILLTRYLKNEVGHIPESLYFGG